MTLKINCNQLCICPETLLYLLIEKNLMELELSKMNNLIFLLLAILFETSATTLLKVSDGFSKLLPTIASIILYVLSFYCLSNCLKTVPIGIAYAIWSALGIVLVTLVGIIAFKQTPDWAAIIGILLIIIGVGVLNLFSNMSIH